MYILEKAVEKYLLKRTNKYGYLCYKFQSPANSGVCDRILISLTGIVFFIETKRPGGKLRKLQEKFIKDLKARGQTVYVLYDKLEVDKFLDYVKECDKNEG
jgi:hypothetical protein